MPFMFLFLFYWQERRRAGIRESPSPDIGTPTTLTLLDVPPSVPVPHAVLDALRGIQTTRYEHSFAARVYGHTPPKIPGLIAVDWESRPPWTLLMDDIRAHYALAQSVDMCVCTRNCHADPIGFQVLRETNQKDRVPPSLMSLSSHLIYARYMTC